jgi:hypothetical protein
MKLTDAADVEFTAENGGGVGSEIAEVVERRLANRR